MEAVNGVAEGPPPPSPLTGCYLLVVLGEPHTGSHKDIILQRLAKGLLSWNVNDCLVDLERELSIVTEQGLEGEEARYGERLIQYASENLVTEILIHPSVSTLAQCIRNLLSSFTRHRHIIHAGYTFAANGSWILQDGTFSLADFSEAFQEVDVQRVIHAYENGISIDIHCSPEGEWTRLSKDSFTKGCKVRINPDDVLGSGLPAISNFVNYIAPFLAPAELENTLESSDVVGNIRFSRPTLYVFPGGQGDAALFGINGFNMLVDGGFSRKACFWDFVRHLDRLDAVILTRLNNSNANGIGAVLRRKAQNAVYPQIGHFFCNIQSRKANLSPDGDKDSDPLLVNLLEEGHELISNLRSLDLSPQLCYRDSEPINLYHKVGHGTLDMYVLNPAKDSREVKEFLLRWNNNDHKLFANHKFSREYMLPLQNIVSICALLVWRPANPNDTITRILFPGSAPQGKVIEGLDKLKNLECIKHTICTEKMLAPPPKVKSKENILDKIVPPEKSKIEAKKNKIKPTPENKVIENNIKNGLQNGHTEKQVTKTAYVESDKSDTKSTKPKRDDAKIVDNKQEKIPARPKADLTSAKMRQKPSDKKGSPPTPKKVIDTKKSELDRDTSNQRARSKISPSATPAKSTKDANNRKVLESKTKTTAKKDIKETKQPDKKEEVKKVERKPISRRPKNEMKLPQSPVKRIVNGVHKPDSLSRKTKLEKEGTTDSSTVSTPSVDQDSLMKKDISKLTPEEVQQLKAQELAELKEEQEAIKELEAVFRKGDKVTPESSDLRKVKEISIEDKTEPEEYLIVEKVTIEPSPETEVEVKEEETVKLARDSEESEKRKDRDDEKDDKDKQVDTEQEESGIGEQETDIEDGDEIRENDISKEPSMLSPEENKRIASKEELAQESQPEEKISTNIESGATTTAPTLPEDERIPLNEIKEDTADQIEEKHVREETREKDTKDELPVITLASKPIENLGKIPNIVGIRLDKETRIRDIVKTPDEVADLPVHEEADVDHLDEFVQERPDKSKVKDISHDINETSTLTKEGEKIEKQDQNKNRENLHTQISAKIVAHDEKQLDSSEKKVENVIEDLKLKNITKESIEVDQEESKVAEYKAPSTAKIITEDIRKEEQSVHEQKPDEKETVIQPVQKEEDIAEKTKKHAIEIKHEDSTKIAKTEDETPEPKEGISKPMTIKEDSTEKAANLENFVHGKDEIPKKLQTVVDATNVEKHSKTHSPPEKKEVFLKDLQNATDTKAIEVGFDEKLTIDKESKELPKQEESIISEEKEKSKQEEKLFDKLQEPLTEKGVDSDVQKIEPKETELMALPATHHENGQSVEVAIMKSASFEKYDGSISNITPKEDKPGERESSIEEIMKEVESVKVEDGKTDSIISEKIETTKVIHVTPATEIDAPKAGKREISLEKVRDSTQQSTAALDGKELISPIRGELTAPKDENKKDDHTEKIMDEDKGHQTPLNTDMKVITFKKDEEVEPKLTQDKDSKDIKPMKGENERELSSEIIKNVEDLKKEFNQKIDVENIEREEICLRQELVKSDGVKEEISPDEKKIIETLEIKSDKESNEFESSEEVKIHKDDVEDKMKEEKKEMKKYEEETLGRSKGSEGEIETLEIAETVGSALEKDSTAMKTEEVVEITHSKLDSRIVEEEKKLIEDSLKKDSVLIEPIQKHTDEERMKDELHAEKKPEFVPIYDGSLSRSPTELPAKQEIKPSKLEDKIISPTDELEGKQKKSLEISHDNIVTRIPSHEEESQKITKHDEKEKSPSLAPEESAKQAIEPPTLVDKKTIPLTDNFEIKKKDSPKTTHEMNESILHLDQEESQGETKRDEKEKSSSLPSEQPAKQAIEPFTLEDKKTIPLKENFEMKEKDYPETTYKITESKSDPKREEPQEITERGEKEKLPSLPSEQSANHAIEPLTLEDKKTIPLTDDFGKRKNDSPETTHKMKDSILHPDQEESQEVAKRDEKEKSPSPTSEQSTKQAIEPPTLEDKNTIPLTHAFEIKKEDSQTTHKIIESSDPNRVESQEITKCDEKEKSASSFSEQSAKQAVEPPALDDKKTIPPTDVDRKEEDSPETTHEIIESSLHPKEEKPQEITKRDEKEKPASPSTGQSAKQIIESPLLENNKTISPTDEVGKKKKDSISRETLMSDQSEKSPTLEEHGELKTIPTKDEHEKENKGSTESEIEIIDSDIGSKEQKPQEHSNLDVKDKSALLSRELHEEQEITVSLEYGDEKIMPNKDELERKEKDTSEISLEIIKSREEIVEEKPQEHTTRDQIKKSPELSPKEGIEAIVLESKEVEKSTDVLEKEEDKVKSQSPDLLTKRPTLDDEKEDKIIPTTADLEIKKRDTSEISFDLIESRVDPDGREPEQYSKTDEKGETPSLSPEKPIKQEQKQEMETSTSKANKDDKTVSSSGELEKEKQDNSKISSEIIEPRVVPEEEEIEKYSKRDEKEKASSLSTEISLKQQEIESIVVEGKKDDEIVSFTSELLSEEKVNSKITPEIIKTQPEEEKCKEQSKPDKEMESKGLEIITSTEIPEHVVSEVDKTSFGSTETVTTTAQNIMLTESGDEKNVGLPHENIEDVSDKKIDGESDTKTAEGQSKQEVTEEPFLPFLSKRASLLEGAEIPIESSEKEDKVESKDINLNQEYLPLKPRDITQRDVNDESEEVEKDNQVSYVESTEISEILGNLIKDADPDSVLDESKHDDRRVEFSGKEGKSEILEERKDHSLTEKLSSEKESLPEKAEISHIKDQAEQEIQKTVGKEDKSQHEKDIHLHDIHNFLEQERSHTHKEMGSSVTDTEKDKKVEDVEKPIKEKPLDEIQSKLAETGFKQVQELKEDEHKEKNITETSSSDSNKIDIGKDERIKPDTDHDENMKVEEDSKNDDSIDDKEDENIFEKGMEEAKEKVENIEHDYSGKVQYESEKPFIKTEKIKIDLTDKREHAEAVLLKSTPESPVINIVPSLPALPTDIDKMELGRKSPKEREGDVAKIVVSVATVLKSDAPLEEFHGKIPLATNTPYGGYTTELRETHITTCDSPVHESTILHEEPRQPATDKRIESGQIIDEQSNIIIEDKDEEKSGDPGLDRSDESEDPGTVHRMLVTASSEDGGEEIEICPAGTITFSKSSESSGRSSPENMSRKLSQSSSALDTISDHTTIKEIMEPQTKKEPVEEQISKTTIESLKSIEKLREDPLVPKLYPDIDLRGEVESLEDQIECQVRTVEKEDKNTSKGASQDTEDKKETISGKVYSIFGSIFSGASKIEEAISHTLTDSIHYAESTIDEGFKRVENEIEEVKNKITKIESDAVESLSEKKEKAEHMIADRLKESASSLEKVLDQTDKDKDSLIQDAQSTLDRVSAPFKESLEVLLSNIGDSIEEKDDSMIIARDDISSKMEKPGEVIKHEIHESEDKTISNGKSHIEASTSEEDFIAKSTNNLYPSLQDELKDEERVSDISASTNNTADVKNTLANEVISPLETENKLGFFTEEKKVLQESTSDDKTKQIDVMKKDEKTETIASHKNEVQETSIIQNGFDHDDNIVDKITKESFAITGTTTMEEKLKDDTVTGGPISSSIAEVKESKCYLDKEPEAVHKSITDEVSNVQDSDVQEDTSTLKDSKIISPVDIKDEPPNDKNDIHETSKAHPQISSRLQHEIDNNSSSVKNMKESVKELTKEIVDDLKEKEITVIDDTTAVETKITRELVNIKDSIGSAVHESIEKFDSVEKGVTSLTQGSENTLTDFSNDLKEETEKSKENLESSLIALADETGKSAQSVLSGITSTIDKALPLGFCQKEEESRNIERQKDGNEKMNTAADKKLGVEISEKSDTTKQDTPSVITDISTIVKEEIESSLKDLIGGESNGITDSLESVKHTALESEHSLKEDTEKALGEITAKSVQLLIQEKENVLQKSSEFQTGIEGTKKAINAKIEDISTDIKGTKENLENTLINTKGNIESSLGEVVQNIEKEKDALKLASKEIESELKHAVDDVLSTGKQLFSGLFGSRKEESIEEKSSVTKKEEKHVEVKLDTDEMKKTDDGNKQNKVYTDHPDTEKIDIFTLPKIEARETDEAKKEKCETDTNLEISCTSNIPDSCDIRKDECKSRLDVEPRHEKKLSISDVEIIVGEKLKDSSDSKHSITTEHVSKPNETCGGNTIELSQITQREETSNVDDLKGKIQDIAIEATRGFVIADTHITDVPSTESSSKENAVSITPVSDDHKTEKQSEQSLSQVQKSPIQIECEKLMDSDDDSLGSPRSMSSQVPQSKYMDPMSMSFYGALPDQKDTLDIDEPTSEDVDYDSSVSFVHLHDITKAKFDGKIVQGSESDEATGDTNMFPPHDPMTSSFYGELPGGKEDKDPIESWGKPLGLPSPAPPNEKGTPKKERRLPSNVMAKNRINDDRGRSESPSKNKKKINPVYVDLTYVPHHGNSNYAYVDFFKKVRARYYVFSGIEPSREVYNALLEAKQTWEDKDLEVTIIPTYDTDVLGYWVAENEELLAKYKIDLSPSASRCTINLQDHETSCSAYRLEF